MTTVLISLCQKSIFSSKLSKKTPPVVRKFIKLFIFFRKKFLLKILLWTDKDTNLTICWEFFAEVQKTSTQSLNKVFEDNHSPKKRQFSFTKTCGDTESNFSNHAEAFLSVVRNFSPLLKISLGIFKQLAICLFFFKKKNSSWKRFFRQKETQNWRCCWIFLPKSDTFPLNDWKTLLDHYLSIIKNIFSLNKFIWTQWCAFHESAGKFRQNLTKFRSSCENVFATERFPRKKTTKSSMEAWNPAMTKVLVFSGQKSIFFNFFKRLRSISERKYQTFKKSFRKETISLKKFPRDRPNAFLTIGWRFIAKVWQFSAQEPKKNQKHFFSKKNHFPSILSFGHRDAFLIIIPKNDKKTEVPLKIWIFIGLFFGRTCVSPKVPTEARSRVLTTVLIVFCQILFLLSKISKKLH